MALVRRWWLCVATVIAALAAGPLFAECGGSVNCIAVGPTLTAAQNGHHGLGPDTFTIAFGERATGTVSPARTIFVVAVTGPTGSMARLAPISIQGPDAADFRITPATTCSPSNGPVHGGAHCVVAVTFSPLTAGAKTATVNIPLESPACPTCIPGRSVSVTGTATQAAATAPVANPRTESVPFNTPTSFDLATSVTGEFTQVEIASPPARGTATLAGTVVTYTPQSGYSGPDSFTYTATGPGGTSAPATVSLNVGAPSGPMVAPRTLAVAFETPTSIDLATGITGTFTSVAIASPPQHGAVTLQGTVATYTPASGYSGPDAFTYTATGPGGTSLPATVSITVGTLAPTAGDASFTVTLNGQVTFDLAPFVRGSGISALSVVEHPAHGTVTLDGTLATYTPNRDFFGTDRFRYVAIGNAGTSPPALVTITVTGRPDPTRDPRVRALLGSQAEAARRFSMAQVENVQRRMESRHNARDGAHGDASPFWFGGTAAFGTKDATGDRSRMEFTSAGLTAGADRALGRDLVVGAAIGAARERTRLDAEGSRGRARGLSATLYASYTPAPALFMDALAGFGTLDFRSRRFVPAVGAYAEADRDGWQWFASLAAGYELRGERGLLSPYARIDHSRDRLDAATESGAGAHALAYGRSKGSFTQGALGLRAEGIRETDFGWAKPKLRAEYRHRFEGDFDTTLRYADFADGPGFAFSLPGTSRGSLALGVGSDFAWRQGANLAFEYQWLRASATDASHSLHLRFSSELDASGMPRWLRGFAPAAPKPLDLQADAALMYDDNVSRSPDEARRVDRAVAANVRKTRVFQPSDHTRVVVNATLGGEKFQRFNGLTRARAGLEAMLQYRPSADFTAPTFSLGAQAATEQFESRMRDGYRFSASASVRQPVTDRITAFAAVAYTERDARDRLFDSHDRSARINLDYELGARGTAYLTGEFRRGHFTSSAPPIYGFVTGSDRPDDAFPGLYVYRLHGNTAAGTLGYNLPVGPRDSLDVSWRRVRSSAVLPDTEPKDYAPGQKGRYGVNQFFIAYLLSF